MHYRVPFYRMNEIRKLWMSDTTGITHYLTLLAYICIYPILYMYYPILYCTSGVGMYFYLPYITTKHLLSYYIYLHQALTIICIHVVKPSSNEYVVNLIHVYVWLYIGVNRSASHMYCDVRVCLFCSQYFEEESLSMVLKHISYFMPLL